MILYNDEIHENIKTIIEKCKVEDEYESGIISLETLKGYLADVNNFFF